MASGLAPDDARGHRMHPDEETDLRGVRSGLREELLGVDRATEA
jgi:hypothetical protein